MSLIPGLGRSPGGGHGNPLQYSCLENPMDRGTQQAIVHRVSQSRTRLKRPSTHARKTQKLNMKVKILKSQEEAIKYISNKYYCSPWRRKRKPTPVFLPRKSQGQMKLVGQFMGPQRVSDNLVAICKQVTVTHGINAVNESFYVAHLRQGT